MILSDADTIFASSISKSGEVTPFNWLRRHKIVHWFGHLHFFDPQHCDCKISFVGAYFSLEIGLPTLELWWVWEVIEKRVRDLIPRIFHHTILRISSCTRSNTSWQSEELALHIPAILSQFLIFRDFACTIWLQSARRRCQILWILEERWGWLSSSKWTFKKRVLMYTMSSVYQAASENRGWSFLWHSEYSWVYWWRGMIQSCSQFKDHRILLRHSRCSPCLPIPESEPEVDSLKKDSLPFA